MSQNLSVISQMAGIVNKFKCRLQQVICIEHPTSPWHFPLAFLEPIELYYYKVPYDHLISDWAGNFGQRRFLEKGP